MDNIMYNFMEYLKEDKRQTGGNIISLSKKTTIEYIISILNHGDNVVLHNDYNYSETGYVFFNRDYAAHPSTHTLYIDLSKALIEHPKILVELKEGVEKNTQHVGDTKTFSILEPLHATLKIWDDNVL